jgi:hypothetical protein
MATAKKTKTVSEELNKTNAVARVEAPAVPATVAAPVNLNEWGVGELTSKDIIIPKILVMQGLSKLVTNGDAKMGEFRDSLNGTVLGSAEKDHLEFIPFYMQKVWVIFEEKNGAMKFAKQVPIDASNENWDIEETIAGVKIRRDRCMNFYCLLPQDVDQGGALPYILSFRRTSLRTGQKIATQMFLKNVKAGKTPASAVMSLSGTKQTNDKGTFVVTDAVYKRESKAGEIAEAFAWVKTIKEGGTRADTSDLETEASTISSGASDQGAETY